MAAAFFLSLSAVHADSASTNYRIESAVFSGGGGTTGSIGLPAPIGDSSTTSHDSYAGFWYTIPPTLVLDLSSGLNLISYPLDAGTGLSAHAFLQLLGDPDEIANIQRLDLSTGSYQVVGYDTDGNPQGTDFPITPSEGYRVYAKTQKAIALKYRRDCPSTALSEGLSLAGIVCAPGGFTAFELIQAIGDHTAISAIQHFNRQTGRYETAAYHDAQLIGVDFPLGISEGYFLHMRTNIPEFKP